MKIDSKALFKAVSVCLNIVWCIMIGVLVGTIIYLTVIFVKNDNPTWTVTLKGSAIENTMVANFVNGNEAVATATIESVKMKIPLKHTVPTLLLVLFRVLTASLVALVVLYHLQKIFKSTAQSLDFRAETIRRLKRISLWLALYTPVAWITMLATYGVMYINGYQEYYAPPFIMHMPTLIGAAVLYLIADMFNYGMQLEQENKEFV